MVRPFALLAVAAALALAACAPKASDRSCPSGQQRCSGFCVDPATYASDTANCGGCGIACAAGATCVSGVCACPAGQEVCAHACVDPATYASDTANCGGCGIACGVGTCAGGVCDCGAFTSCPSQSPRCVDGLTDPDHCGSGPAACDHACPVAAEVCDAGTCSCPSGTTACPVAAPSACVDLAGDEANCGGCGTRCATGATCTSGTCLCPAGESVCNGACVNRSTDESNCGACGYACAAGATCGGGSCACPSGQTLTCGQGVNGGGTCCAGNGCCGGACQTEHTNGTGVTGLGQHFYDCLALGTYDLGQAQNAASAWQAAGQAVYGSELGCASQSCFGWRTQTSCGVWCYGGTADPLRGRASVFQSLVCVCPTAGTPNWN